MVHDLKWQSITKANLKCDGLGQTNERGDQIINNSEY